MERILYVVSGAMVLGGTETMLMNWYRNFDRSVLQVDFVCYGDEKGEYDKEILELGGRIYRLPSKRRSLFGNLLGIYKICRVNKYKIMHVHMDAMSFYPLLMAKIAGVKTRICHCHSTQHIYISEIHLLHKKLLTKMIPFIATDLFACSEAAGKWLYGIKPYKVIHNAIDVSKFEYSDEKKDRAKKKFGLQDQYVIGHVGNFNYPKNQEFLIDVFSIIHKKDRRAILLLIGDGPDREKIDRKIKKNNLQDRVILLGQRNDLPEIIHAIDVFVLPSFFEGFPVVLVEAQAAGIPCVVSDKVTKEVVITDLVDFVALDSGEREWADIVLKKVGVSKNKRKKEMENKGYDIKKESKVLHKYYIEKMGNV